MIPDIYQLQSLNLTGLGGMMGTERTWPNWHRYFLDIEKAKSYGEKDYEATKGEMKEKLQWSKGKRCLFHSQDLRYVMYYIRKLEIEP